MVDRTLEGHVPLSFCGGADALNFSTLVADGLSPITVCTDLLKPGGYARLQQYLVSLADDMDRAGAEDLDSYIAATSAGQGAHRNLAEHADRVASDPRYARRERPLVFKDSRALGAFDCIAAPCLEACPTHQNIPDYLWHVAHGEPTKALDVILRTNPQPGVTGCVCDRPCVDRCGLGRRVLGHRAWALLFALANLTPVWLSLGEFWGTHKDALPRVTFQAALPWLWWLALDERRGRRHVLLAMGCAGALFYVHPVSAPAWGVAIGLGLCGDRAAQRTRRDHLVDLALGALVFALVSAPFWWRDFGADERSYSPEETAQIHAAVRQHLFADYFDVAAVPGAFADRMQGLRGVACIAALPTLVALGWSRGRARRSG